MNTEMMLALREAGVDTQGALRRFCDNAALYERFLLKFPGDENFEKIKPALDSGDLETALMAAHTLKGVSGNLGMNRLYLACTEVVGKLRQMEPEQAKTAYQELEKAYRQVCLVLTGVEGARE